MTALAFPADGADLDAAYNHARALDLMSDDPKNMNFWGFFELLANTVENGEVAGHWFKQTNTLQFLFVPITEEGTSP